MLWQASRLKMSAYVVNIFKAFRGGAPGNTASP